MSTLDELRFYLVDAAEYEAILDFLMKYFCFEEPVSKAIGLTVDDALSFFPGMVRSALGSGASFAARAADGALVACRLTSLLDVGAAPAAAAPPPPTPNARKITDFLELLDADYKALLPAACERLLKFEMVSVHPDYYRRGIANKLIELSLQRARQLGCQGVVVEATAFNSQRLFEKLGFRTLRTIQHTDYCDADGRRIFTCYDKTDCGKFMFLPL